MTGWSPTGRTTWLPYIESPYEQQIPPAALFRDVRIWSFPLAASYGRLKRIVDRSLNLCRRYLFFPIWSPVTRTSIVFLRILRYGRMQPLHPPYSGWGYLRQTEIFFAIPVVRWECGRPVQLAVFCPLIFVDNPLSVVSGNMVLGYPKGLARTKPDSDSPECPSYVEIHAFEKHHKDCRMDWRCLLKMQPPVDDDPLPVIEPEQLWPFGPIGFLFGPNGCFPLTPRIFNLFWYYDARDVVFSVQLRQVRDLVHPWRASLQEVVSIPMGLRRIHGGHLLDPLPIQLPEHGGLNIRRYLGLQAEGSAVTPVFPHFVHLDMAGGTPRVLHPRRDD